MIERRDTGPAHLDKTADLADQLRVGEHVRIQPGTRRLVWTGPRPRFPDQRTLAQRRQRIQEAFTDSVVDEMSDYHWREA